MSAEGPSGKQSAPAGPPTVESLQAEINALREQLKKNTRVVLNTGEQVIAMQMEKQRKGLAEVDIKTGTGGDAGQASDVGKSGKAAQDADLGDMEEDQPLMQSEVVDLVAELQGQLDVLDERSIRRTANAGITNDDDRVAPLPGSDGVSPEADDGFPQTLKEFKAMGPKLVEQWARYYELLPPDENEIQELLARAGAEDEDIEVPPMPASYSPEQMDDMFDNLARFMGLRVRRSKGVW